MAIVSALISFHTAAQLSSKEITCPAQLSVLVHKAVLTKRDTVSDGVDKIGNNVCTEFMRAKCLDQASCLVGVRTSDESICHRFLPMNASLKRTEISMVRGN